MNNLSIIQWGAIPASSLLDEPLFSVKSLNVKPTREKKTYKNGKGAFFALRFINPMITFSFVGTPANDATGLGNQHPGTQVTSLLNFASPRHAFDPAQGTMIYEEPEDNFDGENPRETKFDVVQYPFITGPVTTIA